MLKVNFNMVKTFHKNGPIDAAGLGIYRQAIMRNPCLLYTSNSLPTFWILIMKTT